MDEAHSIPTRWIPAYEAFSGVCDGRRHHQPGSGGHVWDAIGRVGRCVSYLSMFKIETFVPLEGKERRVGCDRDEKTGIFFFFPFFFFARTA